MSSNEEGRKGVPWRPVMVSDLSHDRQAEYRQFIAADATVKSLADELKAKLRQEWESKYPDGIDGKTISFTITGGRLQYAMVPMKARSKKGVSDEGDAVFSHPQSGEAKAAGPSSKKIRLAALMGTAETNKPSKYAAAKRPKLE